MQSFCFLTTVLQRSWSCTTRASYQYSCMVRTAGRYLRQMHARSMHLLLGIKWYQFVRNDDVRRLTKQPKLTAIIQSRRLTLFGHIMCMDDNADAKRILLASPPADWRRQLGRPRRPGITWLSTIQQDLKQHHCKGVRCPVIHAMYNSVWTFAEFDFVLLGQFRFDWVD